MNKYKNDMLIISGVNPTRAYSGVKYMYFSLKQNINVTVWCAVSPNEVDALNSWGANVHSFYEGFWGRIPKIRFMYMKLKGFFVCWKYRKKTIICHDLLHYRSCCIIKKLFKDTKLICYFNEIYTEKSPSFQQKLSKYYSKHANVADYMIECNEMRKDYRIKMFGLKMPCGIILNTLPLADVKQYRIMDKVVNRVPKIVYSGGVFSIGDLDIIIDALKDISYDYTAELYCYGNSTAIENLKIKCDSYFPNGNVLIILGKKREEVLRSISTADIGFMYYDPTYSVNTQYAAPTKFFEYVALGIPVVCSNNESLAQIVNDNNLGLIMDTNNSLGVKKALERLLKDHNLINKMIHNAIETFDSQLCYEQQSMSALNYIRQIHGEDRIL